MTAPDAAPRETSPDPADLKIARLEAEIARLERRLAEVEILADRDPLAPVLNKRAFLRELNRVAAYCQRYGAAASVVFFDMDRFKEVNDEFGHAGGDAALLAVAVTLADHVRESDLVGRLGGDEFAVILAQADKAAALAKAESLKALVEANPAVFDGRAIPLRLSYGVRALEPGLTAAELLAEADAAMYMNKSRR